MAPEKQEGNDNGEEESNKVKDMDAIRERKRARKAIKHGALGSRVLAGANVASSDAAVCFVCLVKVPKKDRTIVDGKVLCPRHSGVIASKSQKKS